MFKVRFRSIASILCISASALMAAEEEEGSVDIRSTGYLMFDGGYLNETEDQTLETWTSEYFTNLVGGLRMTARPSERFSVVVNPELRSHNIFPIRPGVATGEISQRTKYDIYIEEAKASWMFGNPDAPRGGLDFGYMIHVDNPDGKVLGNYLFRSMIYPGILFTKMDNPGAYLFGLHGRADFLGGRLKNHVFALSEVQRYPYFDVSLAYSGSYSLGNVLEVGIGVNAKSLIPVRPSRTTPKGLPSEGAGLRENTYKYVPFRDSVVIRNAANQVIKTVWIKPHTHPDSAGFATVRIVDSAGNETPYVVPRDGGGISGMSAGVFTNTAMTDLTIVNGGAGDLYPELGGTNTSYSFAGTVLGGRIAFNPMGFFGPENFLGKDALKLYAEVAVLGWKNYPGFYEKRSERQPIMVGINFPTFNFLDFLSLEVENFPSRDLPTFDRRAQLNLPQPGTHKGEQEGEWDLARRKLDDRKWILAGKRTFGGWGLAFQTGTDHTKILDNGDNDFYNVMTRPAHWYTQVRFFAGIN